MDEDIIIMILIAFGILQIILFFKIWFMTNDVCKIKQYLTYETDGFFKREFNFLIAIGEKEKAKTILINEIKKDRYAMAQIFTKVGSESSRKSHLQSLKKKYKREIDLCELKINIDFI